jgi:hypothetical protein
MDLLTKINSLSIAELRKILKDNDVKETSSDKEGLICQATDVLLTNMAIQEMMDHESLPEKIINENVIPDVNVKPDPNTNLREQQDREYRECLEIDMKINESKKQTFEELSPMSLRDKRLAFYQ